MYAVNSPVRVDEPGRGLSHTVGWPPGLICEPIGLIRDLSRAVFISRFVGLVGSLLFTSGITQKAVGPTLDIFRIDPLFFKFLYGFVVHLFHFKVASGRLLLIFCGRS